MANTTPQEVASGTIDQSQRWEGPQENRPRGYLKAKDDPDRKRDAVGETNSEPRKKSVSDALKTKEN